MGGIRAIGGGMVGAIIARFRPRGMASTLFATAFAQAVVPVIALIIWKRGVTPVEKFWGHVGVAGVFVLNASFAVLFVLSVLLFRRAARARQFTSRRKSD